MNFVYPYIKGPSWWGKSGQWDELKWSIRSVEKHYKDARCVVVGDKPDFDVEHIPVERIHTWQHCDVRHADVIKKLSAFIDTGAECFVLMYDDVYFLRSITQRMIQTPYALCKIEDLKTYRRGKGGLLYSRLWDETYKKVAEMTDELYDWETHLPRFLWSDRVKWLIETFDLMHNGLIFTSLYGALWGENPVLLDENPDIRAHLDVMGPGVDLDEVFSKHFLVIDDNACTPQVTALIEKKCK
jgi:hypothetical protein